MLPAEAGPAARPPSVWQALAGLYLAPVQTQRAVAATRPWGRTLLLVAGLAAALGLTQLAGVPGALFQFQEMESGLPPSMVPEMRTIFSAGFLVVLALVSAVGGAVTQVVLLLLWSGVVYVVSRLMFDGPRGNPAAVLATQGHALLAAWPLVPLFALAALVPWGIGYLVLLPVTLVVAGWVLALAVIGVREAAGLGTLSSGITVAVPLGMGALLGCGLAGSLALLLAATVASIAR